MWLNSTNLFSQRRRAGGKSVEGHLMQKSGKQTIDRDEKKGTSEPPRQIQGKKRRQNASVPKNWVDVAPMGRIVQPTSFLPLRVFLDDKFLHNLSEEQYWTVPIFVQEQAAMGYNIRLVVDLTNTDRYYTGTHEFQVHGIEYVKLPIEGFSGAPREADVQKFFRVIESFKARCGTGNIAVHCTHGLNRTGYLIIQFMVRKCGWSVDDALREFSLARPPGLLKYQYITELYRQFAPKMTPIYPVLPAWAEKKYASRTSKSCRNSRF